ncbi:hypothetical protein ACF1FE_37495 [Streptomyces griseofuscus]|uniref:hypothetical protein n=1 Tax=Streptomyces griseofuscus TaxID=146922 RepID=UPI003701F6BF
MQLLDDGHPRGHVLAVEEQSGVAEGFAQARRAMGDDGMPDASASTAAMPYDS